MSTRSPAPSPVDLVALRRRRPDAVDAWFEAHADVVYTFVYYRVGRDPSMAADVCQDTFVSALERLAQYDPLRGEMLPWLTYLARNCIRKARRQQLRYATGGDFWEQLDRNLAGALAAIDEKPLPLQMLEQQETGELVRLALSNLPMRYQRALRRRYFEQWSVREMADAEGASQGAIKVLLHRARLDLSRLGKTLIQIVDEYLLVPETGVAGSPESPSEEER